MSSRRSRGGLQRSTSNRTRPRLPPLASSSHSRRFGGWFRPLLCSPGSCRPRTWCGAAPPPAGSTSGGSALDPRPPGHPAPSSQAGGGFWRGVSREGKPVLKQHGSPRLLRRPFSYRGCARRGQRPRPARLGSARLQPGYGALRRVTSCPFGFRAAFEVFLSRTSARRVKQSLAAPAGPHVQQEPPHPPKPGSVAFCCHKA